MKKRSKKLLFVWASCAAAALLGAAAPVPEAAIPLSRMNLPWWRQRFEQKQAELHSRRIDLLWLGDSITQSFEKSGPMPWEDFQPIWNRYYAPRNAINLGFKGDATSHLLWRIENGETGGIHPRLAILLIGANNFGKLHWPAAPTFQGIETIIDVLHQRLPQTRVLLLGVLPSIRSAWVDANTAELNRMLAARYAHDARVTYVDLSPLFLKDGHVDPRDFEDPHMIPPDPPLHPDAATQARMAAALEPYVTRLMREN